MRRSELHNLRCDDGSHQIWFYGALSSSEAAGFSRNSGIQGWALKLWSFFRDTRRKKTSNGIPNVETPPASPRFRTHVVPCPAYGNLCIHRMIHHRKLQTQDIGHLLGEGVTQHHLRKKTWHVVKNLKNNQEMQSNTNTLSALKAPDFPPADHDQSVSLCFNQRQKNKQLKHKSKRPQTPEAKPISSNGNKSHQCPHYKRATYPKGWNSRQAHVKTATSITTRDSRSIAKVAKAQLKRRKCRWQQSQEWKSKLEAGDTLVNSLCTISSDLLHQHVRLKKCFLKSYKTHAWTLVHPFKCASHQAATCIQGIQRCFGLSN